MQKYLYYRGILYVSFRVIILIWIYFLFFISSECCNSYFLYSLWLIKAHDKEDLRGEVFCSSFSVYLFLCVLFRIFSLSLSVNLFLLSFFVFSLFLPFVFHLFLYIISSLVSLCFWCSFVFLCIYFYVLFLLVTYQSLLFCF